MIRDRVKQLLGELPPGVTLVAAAKTRTPSEILEAVQAGVTVIGENYVQEAEHAYELVGNKVKWHFIGRLQKNKVKKAARLFDLIETVDSVELATEIDRRCAEIGKVMPVFIEINSGLEPQKNGVMPEDAATLVREISELKNIRVTGLMTIGPYSDNPEDLRPYFTRTRQLFEKLNLTGTGMKHLSMGMTDSYRIALEEGANMVRIGTAIFGARA